MLIQYEYEILSFAALISTRKTDGNLSFLLSNLNKELDEDISLYIGKLKESGLLDSKSERITIITKKWVNVFLDKLQKQFDMNSLEVSCEFDSKDKCIFFFINGNRKKFNIILNKEDAENNTCKNSIYMCKIDSYSNAIYWLELLNDINLLYLFYGYLLNESDYINKSVYQRINNLEGLTSSHISEIFNIAIKKYFSKINYRTVDLNIEEVNTINKIMADDNISYYSVSKNSSKLCIIKKRDQIIFLELKDSRAYYSDTVNSDINVLKEKIYKKVSQYRGLIMYKDNNVLDTTIKLTTQIVTYTAPITLIISILGLLNINISSLIQYKWLLVIAIIALAGIQILIFIFIYLPGYKINRFKWDIK